ncbi:humps family-domain-containing protein [Bombardia bombarda]|uniref:Orotidine 5'-phosphate decarboxylase n=1 Tax=Bombardia bombarda TaxID=252184 RepID=A0AA39XJ82_9PEZI|nr:humps family-domain-containing protein [Bombardia bombarda]
MASRHSTLTASFADRAGTAGHPLSRYLFRLMDLKASNLCLSADVQTARELLYLADKVGPSIVVLKTHYDLISGWDYNPQNGTGAKLAALARKHGFLIFEDRKFVDIGKTVQMQYTAGTARIIDWAHITNANIDAGKDMVRALAEAAAKWRERINYEVKTSVTVGTPVSDHFEDDAEDDERADELSGLDPRETRSCESRDADGRKGSIVSITTVTQSFEPADSPRQSKNPGEGDEVLFAGIEEPPMDRGLLLLAQMSTKGCLMGKDYTQACVEAARENRAFVMGYVAQEGLNATPEDDFIHMTPGCKLPPSDDEENGVVQGDGLGQQYNTPAKLIGLGTDIVIVGRGIINAADPPSEAERYRRKAWKAKCDRKLPCTNCVSRHKQDACRYESGAPTAKEQRGHGRDGVRGSPGAEMMDSIPTKVANWGYSRTGASTLGFLQKIEGVSPDEPLSGLNPDKSQHCETFNTRERYKSLIRQLPARTYIDKLVDVYFTEFNWQYFALDRDLFDKQLAEWYRLPFGLLSTGGPQALAPDLRVFPGLLFQVLAISLLVLQSGSDPTFDSLKYAGNMTFEDLAVDYSESGVAILSLLGKRQMSVTTVLAGFLRASFLKFVGLVTEAWHAIGSAIRDAQEIGLHRDSLDPKPRTEDSEAVLENQWEIQRRRKLWITLVGWDVHTGVILGRPTTIDQSMVPPTLPVDAPLPKDRSKTAVVPRVESDPPTPLTRLLWGHQIMSPLREVLELEKEGPCPKDFTKIDKLHQRMVEIEERTPAYFRRDNPDTRFDDLPECYWLPYVRNTLPQLFAFNLMALHRPYIFTRPKSRTEALRASLAMLKAQRKHFQSLKPEHYKTFTLFFGTFDAIVLVTSIYILFPREHPEMVQNAIQHFHWAVERFEAMADRNALAKAGLGVLKAIYLRLKKFLGITCHTVKAMLDEPIQSLLSGCGPHGWDPVVPTPPSNGVSPAPPTSTITNGLSPIFSSPLTLSDGTTVSGSATSIDPGSARGDDFSPQLSDAYTTSSGSIVGGGSASVSVNGFPSSADLFTRGNDAAAAAAAAAANEAAGGGYDWTLPSNIDWASVQPIYATGDLLYNDLIRGGAGPGTAAQPWQFEGDFGNDSVWSLLNQYTPY